MSLHFKTNKGSRITGKGFYIALSVCLVAIGVAAWTTYDSVVKYANPSSNSQSSAPKSTSVKPTEKTVSGVTGKSVSSTVSKAASSSTASKPASTKPTGVVVNQKVTYHYPLDGTVTKKFSGETLVKSETMGDLRVHSGTDLSAKIGDPVSAIADGKVTDICKEDLLGNVIVITHSGNIIARYCGLGDTALVKKGDTVKAGQKIGSVSTAPLEMSESPHLHLEIKKNGTFIDPTSILTKK